MSRTRAESGRRYTSWATTKIRRELRRLTMQLPPSQYQQSLMRLGEQLGSATQPKLEQGSSFAVVTTPEDADSLTRGLLAALPQDGAHLVCYWTTRFADVASVRKEYVDPTMPRRLDAVVIAKSIISSGCIVRTNLEEFLAARNPKRILIASPVMLKGADDHLRSAFPRAIASRFEFINFAIDSTKDGQVVRPGVGGMVEERLGLKGKLAPQLVKEWRAQVQQARA